MILRNYDELIITYSWGNSNHGICGHTFEVIEYFWILRKIFKTKILICELDVQTFTNALLYKYNFNNDELNEILSNTIFMYKPKIIVCNNILFTDGSIPKISQLTIKAKNKIMFSCMKFDSQDTLTDFIVLEDNRVYNRNNVHYIKKILFDKIKKHSLGNSTLLYLTENCRKITIDDFNEITKDNTENFICISNKIYHEFNKKNVKQLIPPVQDIFSKFNKYIYTPIQRKWDCSSRFIAECRFLGIPVIYYNIDYLEEDLGLKYRIHDVNNDFYSLFLHEEDEIIDILKGYIWN